MKRDTGLQKKCSKLQLYLYGYSSCGTDLRFVLISTLTDNIFSENYNCHFVLDGFLYAFQ